MSTIKKRKSASRGRPAGSVKTKAGKAKKTTIKSSSPLAALKRKIAEQKVEFLGKLKKAADSAYEKGRADVLKDQKKREAAKAKLIAAVERKLDKKYAQVTTKVKTVKKGKKATAKKATAKATVKKTSTVKKAASPKVKKVTKVKSVKAKTGSRGRPSKAKLTTVHHTPVVSLVPTGTHS